MGPQTISTIIAALSFYQEEEMAGGESAAGILSSKEIDTLKEGLESGKVDIRLTDGQPDGFWLNVVETLESQNNQVDYLAPEKFDDDEHEKNFRETQEEAVSVAEEARRRLNAGRLPAPYPSSFAPGARVKVVSNSKYKGRYGTITEPYEGKWFVAIDDDEESEAVSFYEIALAYLPNEVAEEQAALKQKLQDDRDTAAQEAFEAHDFGDEFIVTDMDGWNRDGRFWSRKVYGDGDGEGEDGRVACSFGVEFQAHTTKILDTWTQS